VAGIAALALVVVLLLRPMELWPGFAALHPLEALTALAAAGIAWSALVDRKKLTFSPQLPWLGAFLAIAYATTSIRVGRLGAGMAWSATTLPAIFMVVVAYGIRGIDQLKRFTVTVGVCMTLISAVAVHQGLQPMQCLEIEGQGDAEELVPDGRPCEGVSFCEREGKPGVDYQCERVGAFGTFSTGGRVRWRGQLGDPNELAVFIAAVLPLYFVTERSRDWRVRAFVLLPLLAMALYAVVLGQSRGGQVVLLTIALVHFVRRFGLRGVVVACALAAPIVALSWRDGSEAEASSEERAEILRQGIALLKQHPLIGVGVTQFQEEIEMSFTAHNSYLLAATELGIPGYFAWLGLVWTSVKIPLTVVRKPPAGIDPALVRLAYALALAFAGVLVGIFFLSFTYKQLLFIYLGLAGALYATVREAHPEFEVKIERRDLVGIFGLGVLLLMAVMVVSRSKG
jgi:hypothetical protein